jgi:hypothetical protein
MKTWIAGLSLILMACASRSREAADFNKDLAKSFAAVADSLSFSDQRYGWGECCWQSWLVLRPHGTWTFVHVDSVVQWFEAPADSAVFRAVTARLVQLGFAAGWPSSFGGTAADDVPIAILTLRVPGQCHQVTVSPEEGGEELPSEWLAARALLDSLATNVGWAARSPPAGAVDNRFSIGLRFMCKPSELSVQ